MYKFYNPRSEPTPQLLQTALALYSNDLSGLVLMADNKIGSRITQGKRLCRQLFSCYILPFFFCRVSGNLSENDGISFFPHRRPIG